MSDVLDTLREYAKDWRDRAGDVDPVHKAISEIKRLRSQLAEQYPAGQSEALRSAIAAINVDDEGHPEGNLQYVLIRGFSTLGWSQPTNASNDAIDAILALLPAGSPSPGVTARPTEAADASLLLSEIVTHFAKTDEQPSDWAHTDDHSEFCLDHQSPDKTKFWLDLKTNGEIAVLWKPAGAPKPRTMSFVQKSAAHPTVKVSGDAAGKNRFEHYPELARHIERLANVSIPGWSMQDWQYFTEALNASLTDGGAVEMRERAAKVLDKRARYCKNKFEESTHLGVEQLAVAENWIAAANENTDGARAIRALPTTPAQSERDGGRP